MTALLILCLIINTVLAQTYVSFDTNGDMVIHNVITHPPDKIKDLKIPMGSGKDFTCEKCGEDRAMGKYMQEKDHSLTFTKRTRGYTVALFEVDIQKKKIKYDGNEIKPTFSYMIAAHGIENKHFASSSELEDDVDIRVNWNTMSTGPSTLWFFSPSYTKSEIVDGEGYSKLFEEGKFRELQKISETKGEVISHHRIEKRVRKQSRTVNEHWGGYGEEFEASSGVYMMERSGGKWRAARIAPIEKGKPNTKLSDIVREVEARYGPGNFYWNACRAHPSKEQTRAITNNFGGSICYQGPTALQKWRDEMNHKCIQMWKKYVKDELEGTENKQYTFGHELLTDTVRYGETLKDQKHITAWKQMVEKAKTDLHNLWFNKVHQPRIAYYNCEKNMIKLREIRVKMLHKWHEYYIKYQEMLKAEQPKLELSRTISAVSSDSDGSIPPPIGMGNFYEHCEHNFMPEGDGAHRGYSNLYEREDQNSFILDSGSLKASVSMMGISLLILLVLCCICFGALIIGGIGGYLFHEYTAKETDVEAQIDFK